MFESIFSFLFKYRPIVFQEGTLGFGAPVPGWALLVVGALVLAATAYTYARARAQTRPVDRAVLAALRTGAVALLLFALARPFLAVPAVVEQQNFVGVLLDDSRSMRITDGPDGLARADVVRQAFGGQGAEGRLEGEVAQALAERFQLRFYRFSSETGRVESLNELGWDGGHTRIGDALEHSRDELSTVPLSGLVLVSDGADNSGAALSDALLSLKAPRVPVYAVGVGAEKFERDVELRRVGTPRRVLEGAAVVADLVVAHSGYGGSTVEVLVEDGGIIVGREEVELPAAEEPTVVRVHFKADNPGARRFVFRVPLQEGELVTRNNEQAAVIDVQASRKKILYFEGEPRHEVAFLRRAVAEDEACSSWCSSARRREQVPPHAGGPPRRAAGRLPTDPGGAVQLRGPRPGQRGGQPFHPGPAAHDRGVRGTAGRWASHAGWPAGLRGGRLGRDAGGGRAARGAGRDHAGDTHVPFRGEGGPHAGPGPPTHAAPADTEEASEERWEAPPN